MTPSTDDPVVITCPYLGLVGDRTKRGPTPDLEHRCYAQANPLPLEELHQSAFCLSAAHTGCAVYSAVNPASGSARRGSPARTGQRSTSNRRNLLWWGIAAVALAILTLYLVRDQLTTLRPVVSGVEGNTLTPESPSLIELLAETPAPTVGDLSPTPPLLAQAMPPTNVVPTPSPVPGGSIEVISPGPGAAGWWTTGDTRAEHLDDSFLYAGINAGNPILSLIRFDLRQLAPGASVLAGDMRLAGLNAERLEPAEGGTWSVELLPASAAPEIARLSYEGLAAADAGVRLATRFAPADLTPGADNVLPLDAEAIRWLQQQLDQGAQSILARISGPMGGNETLFAWDSGAGLATGGRPPRLLLSMGEPPEVPPTVPAGQIVVATLTPTPGSVLTAAASLAEATHALPAQATPSPIAFATPTPQPENVATAQAGRFAAGLAPLVMYTSTPENAATADANALLATAVAVTTGTFTPVPTDAVTPIIVLPTPAPQNVATLAAQILTATAEVARNGIPTPLPFGALIATTTPTPVLVMNTPTPANRATAAYLAAEATAIAVVYGTFTPLPTHAVTPTASPMPTALPLIQWEDALTPRPSPTPTAPIPAAWPPALRGKILFNSDRDGEPRLMLLDPATGRTAFLTQDWPVRKARVTEPQSPDGRFDLIVQEDSRRLPQLYVRELSSGNIRQLTSTSGWSYDPAWSPRDDLVAFVSQEVGNDEIYTVSPDGSGLRRLTANTWEWDKHPSWSPDGRQIIFWSNRETGQRQLWIMNADGSGQRRLLRSPYNDWDPIWIK